MINLDKKPSKLHPLSMPKQRYPGCLSLNRNARFRELDSIYEQNRRLLERLQDTASVYSLHKWEHDFALNAYYGSKIKENSGKTPLTH